jgi:hypothetical protein
MLAKRISVANGTYTSVFPGLTLSGWYEVTIYNLGNNVELITDTSDTNGFQGGSGVLKFTWGDTPLYVRNSSGSNTNVYVLVSPLPPVTADVNLSLGSC